jgi:hypothetical protein
MDIKQHKALVAAIPEDLVEGEEIEVSVDGVVWEKRFFVSFSPDLHIQSYHPTKSFPKNSIYSPYARRPAPMITFHAINEKPFQDLNVRPLLRGRYIVTEEYIDGHLTQKTVEIPDDQIRIEGIP